MPTISREKLAEPLSWLMFLLGVLYFVGLKSFSLHWSPSDEAIYSYASWAFVDHGAIPYRDYFFAHPPLKLFWSVPLLYSFGFRPEVIKFFPMAASCFTALVLFLICKKNFGRIAGIVVSILFLNSFTLLRSAGYWTGVHETLFLTTTGLWLATINRFTLSGVCFGLAICTGVYAIPAFLVIGLFILFERRTSFATFLASVLFVVVVIHLIFTALAGVQFWEQVYLYHFRKVSDLTPAWVDNMKHALDDFPLFWLGIAGFAFGIRLASSAEKFSLVRLAAALTLAYGVFITILKTRFSYYYCLLLPGLSIGAGSFVQSCLHNFLQPREHKRYPVICAQLLILFSLLLQRPLYLTVFPYAVREKDTKMSWVSSPVSWVDWAFKACCWEEVARAGVFNSTTTEILYRHLNWDAPIEKISSFVRENSQPHHKIFGDSLFTGFIAALSGRKLVRDFADTNTMRFIVDPTIADDIASMTFNADLKFVLVSAKRRINRDSGVIFYSPQHFAAIPTVNKWILENFHIVEKVPVSETETIYIFEKNR